MLDISWTEFLLIAVVALVVIGPKELPGVLRTIGQYTRKLRSMAADFQSQFQEAMREAEMADLKKQVDDIARDVRGYDPLKDVRADVEAAGKDIKSSLEQPASVEQPASLEPSPEPEPPAVHPPAEAPTLLANGEAAPDERPPAEIATAVDTQPAATATEAAPKPDAAGHAE